MSHNYLGNGTHSHSVRTKQAIHFIFCRSFVSRSRIGEINSVLQFNVKLFGNSVCFLYEIMIVSFAHIWETRTARQVFAAQRMLRHKVYMVCDYHKVACVKFRISSSGGVTHI